MITMPLMMAMTTKAVDRKKAMVPNMSYHTALSSSSSSQDLPVPDATRSRLLRLEAATVVLPSTRRRTATVPHPEDPNLYAIPASLLAAYRLRPVVLQLFVGVVSACFAAASSSQ